MRPRILLVGYGRRGRQWHRAIRRSAATVTGIVDPAPSARAVAERSGLRAWASLDGAFEGSRIDGTIIASPPDAHSEDATRCLRHGLGVLVEKPLAPSLETAAGIVAEAQDADRPALAVQNFRFHPRERALRAALPRIGRPRWGDVVCALPNLRDAASDQTRYPHLWSFCIHHLDAFRTRGWGMPEQVRALPRPDHDETRHDLRLDWASGYSVDYRYRAGGATFHYHEHLQGELAGISVEGERVWLARREARPRRILRVGDADRRVLREFLSALRTGYTPSELSVTDNLWTIALIQAAARATESGTSVAVLDVAREAGLTPPHMDE